MPDKILFATDYPLITQRRFLKRVREAGLEESALNKILGGNAGQILEPLVMTHPKTLP